MSTVETNEEAPAEIAAGQAATPLLEVKDLKKYFPIRKGILQRHAGDVKAVDGLNLSLIHI